MTGVTIESFNSHDLYVCMCAGEPCAMCTYTDILCQMPLSKSKPNFNKVQLTIMYHDACVFVSCD